MVEQDKNFLWGKYRSSSTTDYISTKITTKSDSATSIYSRYQFSSRSWQDKPKTQYFEFWLHFLELKYSRHVIPYTLNTGVPVGGAAGTLGGNTAKSRDAFHLSQGFLRRSRMILTRDWTFWKSLTEPLQIQRKRPYRWWWVIIFLMVHLGWARRVTFIINLLYWKTRGVLLRELWLLKGSDGRSHLFLRTSHRDLTAYTQCCYKEHSRIY